jgi:hypothetical protein
MASLFDQFDQAKVIDEVLTFTITTVGVTTVKERIPVDEEKLANVEGLEHPVPIIVAPP